MASIIRIALMAGKPPTLNSEHFKKILGPGSKISLYRYTSSDKTKDCYYSDGLQASTQFLDIEMNPDKYQKAPSCSTTLEVSNKNADYNVVYKYDSKQRKVWYNSIKCNKCKCLFPIPEYKIPYKVQDIVEGHVCEQTEKCEYCNNDFSANTHKLIKCDLAGCGVDVAPCKLKDHEKDMHVECKYCQKIYSVNDKTEEINHKIKECEICHEDIAACTAYLHVHAKCNHCGNEYPNDQKIIHEEKEKCGQCGLEVFRCILSKHLNEAITKCDKCQESYSECQKLQHQKKCEDCGLDVPLCIADKHKQECEKLVCENCGRKHSESKNEEHKKIECDLCKMIVAKCKQFEHEDEKANYCKYCKKNYSECQKKMHEFCVESVGSSVNSLHSEICIECKSSRIEDGDKLIECKSCKKKIHLKCQNVHSNNKNHKCQYCDDFFSGCELVLHCERKICMNCKLEYVSCFLNKHICSKSTKPCLNESSTTGEDSTDSHSSYILSESESENHENPNIDKNNDFSDEKKTDVKKVKELTTTPEGLFLNVIQSINEAPQKLNKNESDRENNIKLSINHIPEPSTPVATALSEKIPSMIPSVLSRNETLTDVSLSMTFWNMNDTIIKEESFICEFCKQRFDSTTSILTKNVLINHFNVCPEFTVMCNCGKYMKRKDYSEHKRNCYDYLMKPCEFCGKNVTASDTLYAKHLNDCTRSPKRCDICESYYDLSHEDLMKHKLVCRSKQ